MRVLLVEDDMVVAGGLAPAVAEAGLKLVGLAADRDSAIALLRSSDVRIAVVDLKLADGWTGLDVARAAETEGVAVLFATGNPTALPDDLAGACGVIEKPYSAQSMTAALRYVAERLAGAAVPPTPRGLTVSPRWAPPRVAPGRRFRPAALSAANA